MSQTNLAAKLVTVASSVGWVEKAGRNTAQNYDFVRAVDVFAQVRKLLAEQRVVFSLDITDVEHIPYTSKSGTQTFLTTVRGNASFIDADTGEVITGGAAGTGADTGDKSTAKAITALLKYALIAALLLPTGDDPEADESTDRNQQEKKSEPKPVTTGPTPPKAEQVRTEKAGLTPKQRGLFESEMHRRGLESAGQRKAFITFATGRLSSKQMTSDDLDKALKELKDDASVAVSNALAVV